MPTDYQGAILHLTAAGVSVLLDVTDGRLPAIIHWGAELPALTAEHAQALVTASVPVTGSNTVDLPPRPSLVPGQASGWTGRPGLRGSFDGAGWSPKFHTRTLALNGAPITGYVLLQCRGSRCQRHGRRRATASGPDVGTTSRRPAPQPCKDNQPPG